MTLTFLDLSTVVADRVIVAVPASLADEIEYAVPLPPAWREFLKVMQLGRCEKGNGRCARRRGARRWAMGGEGWSADAASAAALVWDGTVHGGASREVPIWNWFLGGAQVDADFDAAPDRAAAGRHFRADRADLDSKRVAGFAANRTAWHKDPFARGAYVELPAGTAFALRRAAVGRFARSRRAAIFGGGADACSPASICPTPIPAT